MMPLVAIIVRQSRPPSMMPLVAIIVRQIQARSASDQSETGNNLL